eukprot:TRINITY_DN3248_c1_g2_i1.p1 TRINITY_DN3248_c1_g2~~TRINITY_DN3248_c1_g2_i1.p1  ORF type:complete len:102 (+),score=17.35 TRINITY_DN3248_c1_g2_i1:67-372(+)
MALGGLAGQNCHCQWGLSGILIGIVVCAAAGVFTAIPVFFDYFAYQWYYALCWFWFGLGVVILIFGIVAEIMCGDVLAKKAAAREIDEENATAPTPYIMIQ